MSTTKVLHKALKSREHRIVIERITSLTSAKRTILSLGITTGAAILAIDKALTNEYEKIK